MMRSEFEKLTGIFPSTTLYQAIERKYIEMDIDKTLFCERYKNNTDGLAERIQLEAFTDEGHAWQERKDEVETLEDRIARLEEVIEAKNKEMNMLLDELDNEQEWKPHEIAGNLSEEQYRALKDDGREMSEAEAKQYIWEEFGFEKDEIRILYEVPSYEINRHGTIRRSRLYAERRPLYSATDWNYVRFDCRGRFWEMINSELQPFYE